MHLKALHRPARANGLLVAARRPWPREPARSPVADAVENRGRRQRCPAAQKRIEDHVTGIRKCLDEELHQHPWERGGMRSLRALRFGFDYVAGACQAAESAVVVAGPRLTGGRSARHTAGAGRWGSSACSICWSPQSSGSGHCTPAVCAADRYSWTVLCEIEQLRAI